jgi:hypothetical protein
MKKQFILSILGAVVSLSQAFANTKEEECFLQSYSIQDVQEYTICIEDKINKAAESILSISTEEQTFENTIRPWNRLLEELSKNFHTLITIEKMNSHSSAIASQAVDYLQTSLVKKLKENNLYHALLNCSQKIVNDNETNSFQRYIAEHFINNSWYKSVYLHEENALLPENFETSTTLEGCVIEILESNADVVYIPKTTIDQAYDLYKGLRERYPHFIFCSLPATSEFPGLCEDQGVLIASKSQLINEESISGPFDLNPPTILTTLNHISALQYTDIQKVNAIAKNVFKVLPVKSRKDDDKTGGSIEGGVSGKWGDGKGIQWEGYIKGEAHDKKGNYAEGEVRKKEEGGSFDVHGGRKKND